MAVHTGSDSSDNEFQERLSRLRAAHEALIATPNTRQSQSHGHYARWKNPVITCAHIPLEWRFDLRPDTNPRLLERLPVNAAFNSGAIYRDGRHHLVVRVEGADRKSFFAVAESESGVDGFRFRQRPISLPQTASPDVNVYDMRLTEHEDGWIYGLFCTERKDTRHPSDTSAATAMCGIARTRDLDTWERLPDLVSEHEQQRNVVLHPEFVNGQYALYTRPQDGFIEVGAGGGIGFGLCASMEKPHLSSEQPVEGRRYHTINEVKNGQGPPPLRTDIGWLHLAHGVRNTAAGLRYVLYMFVTALDRPWQVTHRPGGHFIAPLGKERVGDVSNVVFSNGWTATPDGHVYIYYASSDTRMHVATTTIDVLVDYCLNTPEDPLFSHLCVAQRLDLIAANAAVGP